MECKVRFTIPTEFIGAEYEDEFTFDFAEDDDETTKREQIEWEFKYWVNDILDDLRASAEWEIL